MSVHDLAGLIGAVILGGVVLLAVLIFVDNAIADRKRKRVEAPLVEAARQLLEDSENTK
jgi:hypothetical protein